MLRDARCLITGASSGLGRAIALELAGAGAILVLTGRNEERLERTRLQAIEERGANPGSLVTVVADLTVPEERDALFTRTDQHLGGALDLVVNAAGVGAYGRFESHDPEVLRQVFEVNVFALAEVCRQALPRLRLGNRPSVVNFGSIVARRALPGRSEYSASKHAVAALSDALRAEWAIDGIGVLLVNPGFTATPFESNVLVDTAYVPTAQRRTATPERVARATIDAVVRDRSEINLGLPGRFLLLVNRLMPTFVSWGLSRWTTRLYERYRHPGVGNGPRSRIRPRACRSRA
jgi:short-subunit dehydrogenase